MQQKRIPLYVKAFLNPEAPGTKVSQGVTLDPKMPCFIQKENQTLISIASLDFSYIVEEHMSFIFNLLHTYKMKVHVIQNSAISFSVCVEDKYKNFERFQEDLKTSFNIKSYENTTLYTIRHFDTPSVESIKQKGKAIISQINTETAQLVIQE